MKITISEKEKPIEVENQSHLDLLLSDASAKALAKNILGCILIKAENGNELSFVIGGDETVLGFTYDHGDPPYYASKGPQVSIMPVKTCDFLFEHHTEFPRSYVTTIEQGLSAVREFFETGNLPKSITWQEI